MIRLLSVAQLLIGLGLALSLGAAIFGGPGLLTLFLTVGQSALIVGAAV